MSYRLVYDVTGSKKAAIRILMLALAVVIDFVGIFVIVQSVLVSPKFAYFLLLTVGVSTVLRIFAIKMQRKIEYCIFDDRLNITIIYPIWSKKLFDCIINEIQSVERLEDSTAISNCENLSDGYSEEYLLVVNGIKIKCNLDDYMYAVILEGINK